MLRERSDRDVLRMPMGPGIDGFMALMHPATRPDWARPAIFEACECGVLVARHAIELGFQLHAAVPIRISVDADRLPTNASRSEVRRADAPIAESEKRVPRVFEALVKRVAEELGPEPALEWPAEQRQHLLASAFQLLASALPRGDFRDAVFTAMRGPLAPLGDVPLFRDAFGRPKTLFDVANVHQLGKWRDGAFVYRGETPLAESLEEFLSDLIWVPPGDPAWLLVRDADAEGVRERIESAELSVVARRKYLRYAVHDGGVATGDGQLLSIALGDLPGRVGSSKSCLSRIMFESAALDGELCLKTPGGRATVSYLYDSRLLARRQIESPVAFSAVVSSPLLSPNQDFSGILADHGADTVDRTLVAAAIFAAEALARRMVGEAGETGTPRQRWVGSRSKLAKSTEVHGVIRSAVAAYTSLFDVGTLAGPLLRAPAYDRVVRDGPTKWVSIADIADGAEEGTMFVSDAGTKAPKNPGLPPKRLVVSVSQADRDALRPHMPKGHAIVQYARQDLAFDATADDLAADLVRLTGAALSYTRPDGFGAIGFLVSRSVVEVRHRGRLLMRYEPTGLAGPCSIVYEGPSLVPSPDFQKLVGGAVPAAFEPEERALVSAIVRRVLGEHVPELHVEAQLFDDQVVPLLFERLGAMGLDEALAPALRSRFTTHPFFTAIGKAEPQSLDDLAALHATTLPHVEHAPADDLDFGEFHPLVAPARLAKAVAAMLGIPAKSARGELERRERVLFRRRRLEAHYQKKAESEPTLDDGSRAVDFPTSDRVPRLRAALSPPGLGCRIRVLVDDRFFCELTFDGPPLTATARVRATAADQTFDALTDRTREAIENLTENCVPVLLSAIARVEPMALRREASVRQLLDWWLVNRPMNVREDLSEALEALGRAKLFDTVQGDTVGALDALRRTKVYVASYVGMWIGPDEGEAPHSMDRPVLRVAEGQMGDRQRALIEGLSGQAIADVSSACEQLQARRRVLRGLVPKPTLHGHSGVSRVHDVATLVGKNQKLRAALGPGEIGLSDDDASRVLVHRDGSHVGSVAVEVRPPVLVTLESPDVPNDLTKAAADSSFADRVQELADALVRRIIQEDGVELLTTTEKRRIRSAMLEGKVLLERPGADDLPLFETTAGLWLTKKDLRAQSERFTNAWYVADFSVDGVALDEERHVFRMTHADATMLLGDVLLLLDATEELRLDALARRNLARRPLERIELDYGEQSAAMGYEILKPRGDFALEGIVAPLRPGLGAHRGLRLSRARHPLDEHPDPCEWPTRAVVDAPGVEPDRTWSAANIDHAAYSQVRTAVRAATEKALRALVAFPEEALEPRRVTSADCRHAGVDVPVRGGIWASRSVGTKMARVIDRGGVRDLRPPLGMPPLPIEGTLFVDAPSHAVAAETLAAVLYRRMAVGMARRLTNVWDPLMGAHVVHALATSAVKPTDLPKDLSLPLGVSRPLDVAILEAWTRGGGGVVWVVKAAEVEDVRAMYEESEGGPTADDPWLIDDGSIAATALLSILGPRAKAWPPAPTQHAVEPRPVVSRIDPEARDEEGASQPLSGLGFEELFGDEVAERDAPLEPPPDDVVDRVQKLLVALNVDATVTGTRSRRRRSMVKTRENRYELAERDPVVARIQAALDAGDPRAPGALSILAARIIGEANRARDDVTDAHELEALHSLLGVEETRHG
jgi:hypothetical protein